MTLCIYCNIVTAPLSPEIFGLEGMLDNSVGLITEFSQNLVHSMACPHTVHNAMYAAFAWFSVRAYRKRLTAEQALEHKWLKVKSFFHSTTVYCN